MNPPILRGVRRTETGIAGACPLADRNERARPREEDLAVLEAWGGAGAAVGPWVAAAVLLCLGVLNVFVARDLLSQWRLRQA